MILSKKYGDELRRCQALFGRYKFEFQSSLPRGVSSDFVIRVGGDKIFCHMDILSCRSPYFAKMFETREDRILIKDFHDEFAIDCDEFDAYSIKTMVDFIYDSEIPELNFESATTLSKAADKFQVQELKIVCEEYLKTSIDESNASKDSCCSPSKDTHFTQLTSPSYKKKPCGKAGRLLIYC